MVVVDDSNGELRFLMVRHKDRAWEMPGGGLLPDEAPVDGARREFQEETGHDVELVMEHPVSVPGGLAFFGKHLPQLKAANKFCFSV